MVATTGPQGLTAREIHLKQGTPKVLDGGIMLYCIVKGKAIPLQAWTGPEVSRMLRFPDFKTIGT